MKELARNALKQLLRQADRKVAGVAKKIPGLTARHLKDYQALRSLPEKEEFDASLKHAQAIGAIRVYWPPGNRDGFIERVELVDISKLAGLLETETASAVVSSAAERLRAWHAEFPVLGEVVERWGSLKTVRGSGPQDCADWTDACKAIGWCRSVVGAGSLETALRDASARVFRNSKRLEKLVPEMDVLLTGSIDGESREPTEVLQELGLYKEPQPVRLAGKVVVQRSRVTAVLDTPYSALPAEAILSLASVPAKVITIENLTTFSALARASSDAEDLLIYTGGMPSPSWSAMYDRLLASLPADVQIFHWGDVDEGGFRIAAFIAQLARAQHRPLKPWKMKPSEVPGSQRRDASGKVVERMGRYAQAAGWHDVAAEILEHRFVAEQEG